MSSTLSEDHLHDSLHLMNIHLSGVVLIIHLESPAQLVIRSSVVNIYKKETPSCRPCSNQIYRLKKLFEPEFVAVIFIQHSGNIFAGICHYIIILCRRAHLNTRFAVATPWLRSGNRSVNCVSERPPGKSFLNPTNISSISVALCLVCCDSQRTSDSGNLDKSETFLKYFSSGNIYFDLKAAQPIV